MALEQLTRTVDFVQDATPSASDANDGETYLDTSLTPPRLKIFDASAGSFIEPRSVQNLDQTVSSAASLTRISASYDLQTAKLVQKQNLLGTSDIEINAFGTRALELTGDLVVANNIGTDAQDDTPRTHEDFNVSNLDDGNNGGIGELDTLTGNSGFTGIDTHVIGGSNRDIVSPTGFVAVSVTPVRMYEFVCDGGTASPFTEQGLNNTSVSQTTDISDDVAIPKDIVRSLFNTRVAVLDSKNDKVLEYNDITDSTPTGSTDISAQTTSAQSIAFDKRTNDRFYVGDENGKIYAYAMQDFEPRNLSFIGSVDFSSEVGFDGNPTIEGLEFGDLGRHMYIASSGQTDLLHYRLGEVTPTYE